MPKQSLTGGKKRKCKTMRGGNFLTDAWDGFKSAVNTIVPILKSTKAISTVANLTGNPIIGSVAGMAGFGKRQKGRGKSVIKC
jgi:hypothetical protein